MGFFLFLIFWLLCGFAFFRIWAWRCKPVLNDGWVKQWKMCGTCGIDDGFEMSSHPVWRVKNAATVSMCFGPLMFVYGFFRYLLIGMSFVFAKIANSVIPKDQEK